MTERTFKLRLIASNDATRSKGLMFAQPLEDDEIALFLFPSSQRYAFWNKNVSFGLTLAFLDENGEIVDVKDLDAEQTTPVAPESPARFVVEGAKGVFAQKGIKKGDIFHFDGSNMKVIPNISKLKENFN